MAKRPKPPRVKPEDVRVVERDPSKARPELIFGEAARKLAEARRKREAAGG